VSFESRDEPGRFLRHAGFRVWADKNDGTTLFKRDASFRYVVPFNGSSALARGLESQNYSGRYLRHTGSTISLVADDNSPEFEGEATWWLGAR
jgi:hypothetical protein